MGTNVFNHIAAGDLHGAARAALALHNGNRTQAIESLQQWRNTFLSDATCQTESDPVEPAALTEFQIASRYDEAIALLRRWETTGLKRIGKP